MGDLRFLGVPRPILNAVISEQVGWRQLGYRMLQRAQATCPVGESEDRAPGPHLRDSLEVKFISGADPRILIGSSTQGQKLSWVIDGTSPHEILPKQAKALRFTSSSGDIVFAAVVHHPGTKPSKFLDKAIREIAQEAGPLI